MLLSNKKRENEKTSKILLFDFSFHRETRDMQVASVLESKLRSHYCCRRVW